MLMAAVLAQAAPPPVVNLAHVTATPVQKMSLSGDWAFLPVADSEQLATDEVDRQAAELSDDLSSWHTVAVPQMLNRMKWWLPDISLEFEEQEKQRVAALPFDAETTNAGWYLYQFDLPEIEGQTPELRVSFEGVAMVSRVYVNGTHVGGHVGMFGEFGVRLTPHLKWGQTNALLVYVERGRKIEGGDEVVDIAVTVPISRDMLMSLNSGMFGGFGRQPRAKFMGIWQDVTLHVSRPGGQIDDAFFKPTLTGHDLEVTIDNPADKPISGTISYAIREVASGELLTSDTTKFSVNASATETTKLTKDGLSPTHWLPQKPHLYELVIDWIADDGTLLDSWSHKVGYRTVETRGRQVLLNGKPYWSRGANMPPYGYKPTDEATARGFLELMVKGNTPITRSHGNPFNRMWLDLCDELGIGVSAEGVRPWALTGTEPPPGAMLIEHWTSEQLETVKQYRNHPSILFYCVSNEGLQRDWKNPDKIAIFTNIINGMRELDDSRPIFQTSGGVDHGGSADMEDIHSYWGWYHPSSYVNDYGEPIRGNSLGGDRPFINQECAVPYQILETGAVHPIYKMHYSAHPWIGQSGVDGDPAIFSEHTRAEGKRKSEKLRFQRDGQLNAGVMLFSNVTWIQYALSRPVEEWRPFPVWEGVRQGFEPVLIALETSQDVFYGGDTIETKLFVVNDDVTFRDMSGLVADLQVVGEDGGVLSQQQLEVGDVKYFAVESVPLKLEVPSVDGDMIEATIELRLTDADGNEVSTNQYPICIASRAWASADLAGVKVFSAGLPKDVETFLTDAGVELVGTTSAADVLLIGPKGSQIDERTTEVDVPMVLLQQGSAAWKFIDPSISQGRRTSDQSVEGEFVEMLGHGDEGHPLFDGLGRDDWKWWAQGSDAPAFAATSVHRLNPEDDRVTPVGRYLAPHLYWPGDFDATYRDLLRFPVFEIERDSGLLTVCDLAISESIALDPRAGRTLRNLLVR